MQPGAPRLEAEGPPARAACSRGPGEGGRAARRGSAPPVRAGAAVPNASFSGARRGRGRGSARPRPVPALAAARRRQGRTGAAPLACSVRRRPSTPRAREPRTQVNAGSCVRSRGTRASWKRRPAAQEPGGGAAAPFPPPGLALGSGAAPGARAPPSNPRPSPPLPPDSVLLLLVQQLVQFQSLHLSLLISKI